MVSERTLVLKTGKVPLKYIYRACVSVQMRTILKIWDLVFAYLNCLSCFRFFIVYLKSDKVSLLFFISQVREFQMMGVKYLAECFSKKTQKSALGRNYYQILCSIVWKNQTLCSIVWNYVHKKHAFKYCRHRETIFNHI